MSEARFPWYSRFWPLSRIYFAGWHHGHEEGILRGRFQMGDGYDLTVEGAPDER